jgi:hypothetical protein
MMHNKQPYSFEKTDVRGRFLLKFSCTNVKLETVCPIAANVEALLSVLEFEKQKLRTCRKVYLKTKR